MKPSIDKHSVASAARLHARHERETKRKPISRLGLSCVDYFPSISDPTKGFVDLNLLQPEDSQIFLFSQGLPILIISKRVIKRRDSQTKPDLKHFPEINIFQALPDLDNNIPTRSLLVLILSNSICQARQFPNGRYSRMGNKTHSRTRGDIFKERVYYWSIESATEQVGGVEGAIRFMQLMIFDYVPLLSCFLRVALAQGL